MNLSKDTFGSQLSLPKSWSINRPQWTKKWQAYEDCDRYFNINTSATVGFSNNTSTANSTLSLITFPYHIIHIIAMTHNSQIFKYKISWDLKLIQHVILHSWVCTSLFSVLRTGSHQKVWFLNQTNARMTDSFSFPNGPLYIHKGKAKHVMVDMLFNYCHTVGR